MICGKCKKSGYRKITDLQTHWHSKECTKGEWLQIVEARKAGNNGQAEKLIRKALGIHHPMSEEAKEKLRQHNETHKKDIALRRKFNRQSIKRMQEKLNVKSTSSRSGPTSFAVDKRDL